ncbi:hypothetical protein ACFVZW_18300 [Streptomyces sp. NPDC059567]|uniref:DUF7224 domain-containing protein n=1 Tax=Streptomyces sp. NPDC059567 TaxID=3346867 RepID=UPI0036785A11
MAQLAGLMAAALALWAVPDGQGWLAAASAAVVVMAWIVLGFGLGALVPRAVAAPAVLIGCFAWMTFTASANTTWPRHLTGMQVSASNLTDIVSTEAFVAPIALTGALALAVILVGSRQQPGKILVTASAGLAVAGTLVAYTIVRDWGPGAPMVARTGTTVCSLESPTVCLPKEYSTLAEPAHTAAGKVLPRLESVGIHAPSRLLMTSRETPVSGETWRFHPSHGTGPEAMEIAVALSAAPAGDVPFCSESYQGTPDVVHAWLLLTAGIGAETVSNTTAPEAAVAAARVRLRPAAQQLDWFNSTWTSLKECQTPPALPGSAS